MALSEKAKYHLELALVSKEVGAEVAAAIEGGANPQAAAVAPIADPVTATAQDVANKINEVIAALTAAGLMAE